MSLGKWKDDLVFLEGPPTEAFSDFSLGENVRCFTNLAFASQRSGKIDASKKGSISDTQL